MSQRKHTPGRNRRGAGTAGSGRGWDCAPLVGAAGRFVLGFVVLVAMLGLSITTLAPTETVEEVPVEESVGDLGSLDAVPPRQRSARRPNIRETMGHLVGSCDAQRGGGWSRLHFSPGLGLHTGHKLPNGHNAPLRI